MNAPFELKIEGQKKPVEWDGIDGVDAAHRYVAAHPGAVVTAYATPKRERTGVFVANVAQIIEPGDSRW